MIRPLVASPQSEHHQCSRPAAGLDDSPPPARAHKMNPNYAGPGEDQWRNQRTADGFAHMAKLYMQRGNDSAARKVVAAALAKCPSHAECIKLNTQLNPVRRPAAAKGKGRGQSERVACGE